MVALHGHDGAVVWLTRQVPPLDSDLPRWLKRHAARSPSGSTLIRMTDPIERGFREGRSHNLETNREPGGVKAARKRKSRLTGGVERHSQASKSCMDRFLSVGVSDLHLIDRRCCGGDCRRDERVELMRG